MKVKELFPIGEGVNVSVKKNIPIAAGLGGGSSDAATTLIALNELWGLNLKIKDLINIGAELGSDVPFFLVVAGGLLLSFAEDFRYRWSARNPG